jgi:hypothetical protein
MVASASASAANASEDSAVGGTASTIAAQIDKEQIRTREPALLVYKLSPPSKLLEILATFADFSESDRLSISSLGGTS